MLLHNFFFFFCAAWNLTAIDRRWIFWCAKIYYEVNAGSSNSVNTYIVFVVFFINSIGDDMRNGSGCSRNCIRGQGCNKLFENHIGNLILTIKFQRNGWHTIFCYSLTLDTMLGLFLICSLVIFDEVARRN